MKIEYDHWLYVKGPKTAAEACAFFGLPEDTECHQDGTDEHGNPKWKVKSPAAGQTVDTSVPLAKRPLRRDGVLPMATLWNLCRGAVYNRDESSGPMPDGLVNAKFRHMADDLWIFADDTSGYSIKTTSEILAMSGRDLAAY